MGKDVRLCQGTIDGLSMFNPGFFERKAGGDMLVERMIIKDKCAILDLELKVLDAF